MSNDLISRSALSKEICNKECNVPEFETERELNAFLLGLNAKQIKIMECLSDMPAAYDVDKVLNELREKTELAYKRYMDCPDNTPQSVLVRYSAQYQEREMCLEIVKSAMIE